MNITCENKSGRFVVSIQGKIDTATSVKFEQQIMQDIKSFDQHVILDMGKVDYISSAGLRVILVVAKKLKAQGGGLTLCNLPERIHEIFKLSGFDQIIKIVDTLDTALASQG